MIARTVARRSLCSELSRKSTPTPLPIWFDRTAPPATSASSFTISDFGKATRRVAAKMQVKTMEVTLVERPHGVGGQETYVNCW
ncbi:hypothetical protein PSA01_14070 [Pseudonocardia saturnea]|uniref:Uncharacterized protein n=1 Tax=Pseudonocardia saturnea TaxID=33909 RepID=A0ABQ0RUM3_9PSEU|nr:hypothetical protein Pdca_25310 [Pseudonocardia autotrophica]GEC24378.1 hypothetical protein PSA01_14070 [Pseudonocardia saturnea]